MNFNIYRNRFSLVWLTVMTLFPLSLLLLRFNRGRMPRLSRTPLPVILSALVVAVAVFVGNITIDPLTAGLVRRSFVRHLLMQHFE
jgi:hypothetical protein